MSQQRLLGADLDRYLGPLPAAQGRASTQLGEGGASLLAEHGAAALVACDVPFGEGVQCRVFLADPAGGCPPGPRLTFLERLAAQLGSALHGIYLQSRLRSRASVAERARLARELHDGPLQGILGLELEVESFRRREAGPQEAAARFERIRDALRQNAEDLRALMVQLQQSTVTPGNLAAAVRSLAARVQAAVSGPSFRVYVNDDLVGVELCGAAKNVIALAAGMSDGLGFGDNAKAALITRGLAEMTRLGAAAGAHDATFRGLAGMGDLVATCTSRHSRNRRAGEMIARGARADDVEQEIGQVVEGLATVRALLTRAQGAGVELPISEQVAAAAFDGRPPAECLRSLMARAPAAEA
jgi:hypothetical protein